MDEMNIMNTDSSSVYNTNEFGKLLKGIGRKKIGHSGSKDQI